MSDKLRPLCCDCGIGTLAIDEFYMVNDDVWNEAWAGRRKPQLVEFFGCLASLGPPDPRQEILCIGCLEKRIGRTLCRADFKDVPLNDPNRMKLSERLLDRLQIGDQPCARPIPGRLRPDLGISD